MIDAYKIEEATKDYINKNNYFAKYEEDPCVDIEFAYKDGAHWAINEFLKDLWHPMQEEPKLVGEEIIIETFLEGKRNTMVQNYMVGVEFLHTIETIRWISDWDSFLAEICDDVKMIRWCYFKDLLPKEGGEQ